MSVIMCTHELNVDMIRIARGPLHFAFFRYGFQLAATGRHCASANMIFAMATAACSPIIPNRKTFQDIDFFQTVA